MLSSIDKQIIRLLELKLKGHHCLSNKIIRIKNQLEEYDTREFYIESNFYNWLINDIFIRNRISKIKKDYLKLYENEKTGYIYKNIDLVTYRQYPLELYYLYYDNINDINTIRNSIQNNLGLDSSYIRKTSLTDCFHSKWWMTTEKVSIQWGEIHIYIKFPFKIKIYTKSFIELEHLILNNSLPLDNDFRKPTIKEKNKILSFLIPIYYNQDIIPLTEYDFQQNFTNDYIIANTDLEIF